MIEGVDHIGIAVASIEESRGFYEALGLFVEEIEDVPQEKVRVAMIPCGAMRIELLEPTADDSPIAKFLDKRGPGLHHVCLKTGDILADDQLLREKGLPCPARPAFAGSWRRFGAVHSPQERIRESLVELAEPQEGH